MDEAVRVRLVIERVERPVRRADDEPVGDQPADRQVYEDVAWVKRGGAHYLRVDESSDEAGENRTVYRIEHGELTVIRYGAVAWNHRFAPQQQTSSTMTVRGAGAFDVVADTRYLDVELGHANREASGRVAVRYVLVMGGVTQDVEVRMTYG